MPDLPHSPAADRNREPILAQLRALLSPSGTALEIASGTGQHAAYFAAGLPGWTWQPTDADAQMLPVIDAHAAGFGNVLPAHPLDATSLPWTLSGEFDLVFCANMLHIAPWSACRGLMAGASQVLRSGGRLVTYGPYFERDVPAAPSNIAFDESLRARDAAWGIRALHEVVAQAHEAGLTLAQRHPMPANNLLLVFERKRPGRPTHS